MILPGTATRAFPAIPPVADREGSKRSIGSTLRTPTASMTPRPRSFWRRLLGMAPEKTVPGLLAASEFERLFLREKALADRSLRTFVLVVFDLGGTSPDDLTDAGRILVARLRGGDAAGRLDERRVAALLASTDSRGAWTFADDVMRELARAGHQADCRVYADMPFEEASEAKRPEQDDDEDQGGPSSGEPQHESVEDAAAPASAQEEEEALEDLARAVRANGTLHEDAAEDRTLSRLRESGGRPVHSVEELLLEPLPWWKRAMDVAVAGSALAVLAPLLAVLAMLVRLSSPGPILFRQQRAGLGGHPFTFYKFRSMYVDAEARKQELMDQNEADGPVFKMKNDPRVTPIGRVLRRFSLDELPQLWNVLRGDMTLVGPRPPTMDEVPAYESWQRQRLHLTGGLTCTWQVSGRSDVPFEEWMRMDARYARQRGFKTDVRLLFATARALFTGRGAY